MTDPSDEEIAAALAAVQLVLAEPVAQPERLAPPDRWRAAARLAGLGIAARPGLPTASWGSAERWTIR